MDEINYMERFGFNPESIGIRYRGHWVIVEPDDDDIQGNAKAGDLCVKSRDGASNPICMDSLKKSNCVGTVEDGFDRTFRYYYFTPLFQSKKQEPHDA